MVIASKVAQEVKHPCNKLMNRCGMSPPIIGVMLQFFQQFTGINAIVFYAPVLFQTIGFKNDASLLSSMITGSVNVFVSVFAVVKFSRRILLLQASIQMFVCQMVIGAILLVHLHAIGSLTKTQAWFLVLLVCLFVMAFAWSWGPLAIAKPSLAKFPLEAFKVRALLGEDTGTLTEGTGGGLKVDPEGAEAGAVSGKRSTLMSTFCPA
ncbi:hypothetical protein Gotur_032173 [Gossypium turneri]